MLSSVGYQVGASQKSAGFSASNSASGMEREQSSEALKQLELSRPRLGALTSKRLSKHSTSRFFALPDDPEPGARAALKAGRSARSRLLGIEQNTGIFKPGDALTRHWAWVLLSLMGWTAVITPFQVSPAQAVWLRTLSVAHTRRVLIAPLSSGVLSG